MARTTCERCDNAMPLLAREDARFCSGRCRVAAHRAKAKPPAELTKARRWVRHSARKVPLTVDGHAASSTDRDTWATYAEARGSTVGAGLGFVLDGDGVVCLDIDHCLDGDGQPLPWAAQLLARVPRTWIEVSPSGDGLHVWGRADFTGGRKLRHVEVYGSGRYITVTGRRFSDAPADLADITDLVSSLT